MLTKKILLAAAIAAALGVSMHASAADARELADELTVIRTQIKQMKADYEARLQSLEQRLQAAQDKNKQAASTAIVATTATEPEAVASSSAAATAPTSSTSAPAATSANGFNPAISLTLGGTYANLSQDPSLYRLQGFMTGGEVGPGSRSFNLGESELTFRANVDHIFSGEFTVALAKDNTASVEESFVQAKGLSEGLNLKAGRFLSSIGYLNNQHAHVWDFVDAPLAYQAYFGGQYRHDGLQAKWIAPTDTFIELGAEIGNGASFPGTDRNKNGANAVAIYAHAGGDISTASSWRAGLSYLGTRAENRQQKELDGSDYSFSGNSNLWIADAVYKWAPGGNSSNTNFKLQGEYFRRNENGSLSQAGDTGAYNSTQSGWYLQGIYQFMPGWRAGLRYDRLSSGTPTIGLGSGLFPSLASYSPSRTSLMFDYSPSEFSRLRLQLAQDKTRPGVTDHQLFLQYIMSLGAHGSHNY